MAGRRQRTCVSGRAVHDATHPGAKDKPAEVSSATGDAEARDQLLDTLAVEADEEDGEASGG